MIVIIHEHFVKNFSKICEFLGTFSEKLSDFGKQFLKGFSEWHFTSLEDLFWVFLSV